MPEFSPKQQQIIKSRNENILVSAAAGSGKTTVLVGRIIDRVTDKNDPINIDEILVLTFTKAAAAEMRERIASALSEKLEENPEDEHLQKQATLIYNAQISTIDSFCLNVLKNNFTEIGLEPGFRLASEAEMTFLIDDILEECLEEILDKREIPYIDEFLNRFASRESLKKIKEVILNNYKEADKAPFINDYLDERLSDYEADTYEELCEKTWFQTFINKISSDIEYALDTVEKIYEECENYGPVEYLPRIILERDYIESLPTGDFSSLLKALKSGFDWGRLPGKVSCNAEQKEKVKNTRELYKDLINKIKNDYAGLTTELIIDEMKEQSRVVKALMEITRLFYQRLDAEKRVRGLITFSDMEHLALQVLLKKVDGEYLPTQVAMDYRLCYRELMIDEYQDSNYVQEAIIHSISGEDDGRYDRFIVGDIKQSIYRFRNANPELFMEKYDAYTENEGPLCRINLARNYRSRESVINAVNTVFERVMDRSVGGVDYDDSQRLYLGAEYTDTDADTSAELLIMKPDDTGDYTKEELESLLIAKRIKELVGTYRVQDKETRVMRPCEYKDIVILLRGTNDIAEQLKKTMEENGIPAFVTSKSGYFNSLEIITLLNYLRIINNPYNEIPLFGTLKSVFGGFNDDEIAALKIINKESIYGALISLTENDINAVKSENPLLDVEMLNVLTEKSTAFIDKLKLYREKVPYTPIHELLRIIINDYGYVNYMSALPMGNQRRANILMLLNKAETFENDGFKGLFNFTRYIEKLKKYETDEGEVVTLDENANVVRIMTMHKSKGLEFPVCILARLHKGLNHMDERSDVVYHNKYGIGLNYVDYGRRIKSKDLRKRFISSMISADGLSEELRILYVAMTRAKEKLIMTAVSDELKTQEKPDDSLLLPLYSRSKMDSFLDVIKGVRYNDDWNGQIRLSYISIDDIDNSNLNEAINNETLRTAINDEVQRLWDNKVGMGNLEELKKRIEFRYSHENLKKMYVKTSVSELKMAAISDAMIKGSLEEIPVEFFDTHSEKKEYIPAFASADEPENSGTKTGSAYHRVMELINYRELNGKCDLDAIMADKLDEGYISPADFALVNNRKIENFMDSDLCRRMSDADKKGNLYKEQPFVLGIAANRLNEEFSPDEQILIQGIIDVFFIEDSEIVLLDYKTDRVSSENELVDRYATQLDYYEEALSKITGMHVKEKLIYSFALEKTLKC